MGKSIEVNCHFCNKNYEFSVDELKELVRARQSDGRARVTVHCLTFRAKLEKYQRDICGSPRTGRRHQQKEPSDW